MEPSKQIQSIRWNEQNKVDEWVADSRELH